MPALMRPIAAALSLAFLMAPASIAPSRAAMAQAQPGGDAPDEVKQVALTDEQLDDLVAAKKDMDAAIAKLPESATDQPDAKTMAALDGVAKAHKFANYGDYDDVSNTVGVVMAGIDPETKKYVGPETVIKKQIAEVQSDKSMKPKDKKEALDELKAALKSPVQVKTPGNIDLVVKHYDALAATMSDEQ